MAQMVNEESRVALFQEYVATGLKALAEGFFKAHGGELRMPSFIEMTHEQEKPKTAKEIMDHVKQRLLEG